LLGNMAHPTMEMTLATIYSDSISVDLSRERREGTYEDGWETGETSSACDDSERERTNA
jgi:hypothetical protein